MTSLRLLQSMKKIGLILLAGFCLSFAPARLAAQSDDPSEVFLKAYMTSQQGEKLEHDNQLQAALAKFPADAAFAVRSSSTFEDMAQAAFAGQHDTYLNVRGLETILDKVRDCFVSLWQDRAVLYRRHQGFIGFPGSLGVMTTETDKVE